MRFNVWEAEWLPERIRLKIIDQVRPSTMQVEGGPMTERNGCSLLWLRYLSDIGCECGLCRAPCALSLLSKHCFVSCCSIGCLVCLLSRSKTASTAMASWWCPPRAPELKSQWQWLHHDGHQNMASVPAAQFSGPLMAQLQHIEQLIWCSPCFTGSESLLSHL